MIEVDPKFDVASPETVIEEKKVLRGGLRVIS